jgi:hypothetical protein
MSFCSLILFWIPSKLVPRIYVNSMVRDDRTLHIVICNTLTKETSRPIAPLRFAYKVAGFDVTRSEIAVLAYLDRAYSVEMFHLDMKDKSVTCTRVRVVGLKVCPFVPFFRQYLT